MSKIFRIFLSYGFLLFIALLVIPQFSKSVFALTFDPVNFTDTINPPLGKIFDGGTVTFTIEALNGTTLPTGEYTYSINIPGNINGCGIVDKHFNSNDPHKIVVTYATQNNKPIVCSNIFSPRVFTLNYIANPGSSVGLKKIELGLQFTVQQAGGALPPKLVALNPRIGGRDNPEIEIQNVIKDINYSYWWNGSGGTTVLGAIADHFHADADGSSGNLIVPRTGGDFSTDGDKKLCMLIGWYPVVGPGMNCDTFTLFNYTVAGLPSTPGTIVPDCSISPAVPTEDSQSVSVMGTHLAKNENFRADLIVFLPDGTSVTISIPISKNSGSSGIVVLPLASSLKLGGYKTIVYDSHNAVQCNGPIDFTVAPSSTLPNSGAGAPPPICIGSSCTLARGTPCDPGSPAIATAIGCIHTQPAAFIKDFLTFIIAISGGLAFLMMILGAFEMLTSAGNPETLKGGQDKITNAVVGLLFIIFAVLLLQIIGAGILNIPGFGR